MQCIKIWCHWVLMSTWRILSSCGSEIYESFVWFEANVLFTVFRLLHKLFNIQYTQLQLAYIYPMLMKRLMQANRSIWISKWISEWVRHEFRNRVWDLLLICIPHFDLNCHPTLALMMHFILQPKFIDAGHWQNREYT